MSGSRSRHYLAACEGGVEDCFPSETFGAETGPAALPRIGLDLPRQLPFDRWLSIGRSLAITASSSGVVPGRLADLRRGLL